MCKNAVVAGAPPRTPLGELTTLGPRLPSWIWGRRVEKVEWKGPGVERRLKGEGRGWKGNRN